MYDYDRALLPNEYLQSLEPDTPAPEATDASGSEAHYVVYFDNSGGGGVAEALEHLREVHGGNVIEFENCSFCPSGNAIWQPD